MNFDLLIKHSYYLFLVIFIIAGCFAAINTGITHDELHDYYVFEGNKNLILNKFFNKSLDTSYIEGLNRFYGSGFHYVSSILENISTKIIFLKYDYIDTKIILSKHISVFIFFFISGLILKKIMKLITNNESYSQLSTIFYLVYPYLFGHSLFNVKDIPFLSVWIICTYLFIKIIKKLFINKKISKKNLFFLSLFTAYLLSIRISGLLILIQYTIFILVLINFKKISLFALIKEHFNQILIFFFLTVLILILLHPSYLNNPLLIFDSVIAMSQHIQTVCTITLGECMPAQNLPSTYLPIWFFFKLPIVILFGLILFFIVEEKFKKESLSYLILISLIITVSTIIILLILLNINLYDEIRQVMFLLPALFIISLFILQTYSKKLFNLLIILNIIFFVFQNIKLYPYNYIWINNFSHISKVQSIFELDYWGASSRNIAEFFNEKKINKSNCIISNSNDALKPFLSKNQCFNQFKTLHKSKERPFYVALIGRALDKGVPNGCKIIHEETRYLNFSKEKLFLARIFRCD